MFCGTISLPGDNGFDPLGLAEDPENLRWYVQAELVNGRWAMLGVAGMLLPEVFTKIGIINERNLQNHSNDDILFLGPNENPRSST